MVNFCAMQGRARASITKKLTSVRRSIIPIPVLEYEFVQVTRGDRHPRNRPQALGWMPDSPRAETLTTSQTSQRFADVYSSKALNCDVRIRFQSEPRHSCSARRLCSRIRRYAI